MARKNNDGKNNTHGMGEVDFVAPPGPTYPDPGPRSATDSTWVLRDRLFKESAAVPKYY